MLGKAFRLLLAGFALTAGCALAQGTFAHITYGAGWQTTFTFVNLSSTDTANLSLFFYNEDGTTLAAPVQGGPTGSPYNFSIAPSGATTIVLLGNVSASTSIVGWASLQSIGGTPVRGQAAFRRHDPKNPPDFEAAVPMTSSGSLDCIVPFPPSSNPVIMLPYDNTTGQYVTAVAFANTTSSALAVQIEFDDQSNHQVATGTLNLAANNHTSFVSTSSYAATANTKGVLRISADPASLSVLGLLVNLSQAPLYPISTLLPITQ